MMRVLILIVGLLFLAACADADGTLHGEGGSNSRTRVSVGVPF